MRLRNIVLFYLGFTTQIVSAQLVGYQDITLPTPSISSSISNNDIESSNLTYGMVSPSINLFTVQAGDISIPITLSHSYNGYKPNDLPGILGLGWSISGGGAVVKSIHGLDDDHINGYPTTKEYYMPQCSTAVQLSEFVSSKLGELGYEIDHFKRLIANGTWDGLPDKFNASGPGLNENFFQYRKNTFSTFPFSATTINRVSLGTEWVVVNGHGTKYFYGEPNHYLDYDNPSVPTTGINSWQLKKVQSGNGESVEFNYQISTYEDRYQYRDAMRYGTKSGSTNITQELLNGINYINYSSSLLESIVCPNYKITYHYSSFNIISDISSNIQLPKLDSIRIIDIEERTFKIISFIYRELNNCFLLDNVSIKNHNNEVIENYKFTYNEETPGSFSYPSRNIDHWGYANGNYHNYLFPKVIGGMELALGGNREANPNLSRFGLLKSMELPTGGSVQYDYENNMTYVGKGIEEFDMLPYSIEAECTVGCQKDTKTRLIRIPFNQSINLTYQCKVGNVPFQCDDGLGIIIRDALGNVYYSDLGIVEEKNVTTIVDLDEGEYILEIYSGERGLKIRATIIQKDCVKDENGNCVLVDKYYDVGGHRITKMIQDPKYGNSTITEFLYHNSGKLFSEPRYETASSDVRYACPNPDCNWPVIEVTGNWVTRSGNSLRTLLRDGNPIMYDTVSINKITKDDALRKTNIYMFHSKYGECANGSFYAEIPGARGQLKGEYLYLNGTSEPIKKTQNIFTEMIPENEKAVIAIHQDFRLAGFNENDTRYNLGSWCPANDRNKVLDSSIITQDGITITKTFAYNNYGLLNSEHYLNSKGENINTTYVYNTNYRSKPVLIEQRVDGLLSSGEKIEYNTYGQPNLIYNYFNSYGYVTTKRIEYGIFLNVLDGSGISKPIQQIEYGTEKAQKSVTSQIWAYNNSFPAIVGNNVFYPELMQTVNNADIGNYNSLEDFLLGVGDFFNYDGSFNLENKEAYSSFIYEIQEALPEAFITFYTYSPLKGVTSKTEPNGKTTYYKYDDLGRLIGILDHNGNILNKYEYNYAKIQN